MTQMNCAVEDLAAPNEPSADAAAIVGGWSEQQCCNLSLLSPIDPLTRLLMKADGVSEAYLDALVRRIAKRRGCGRG